MIYYLKTDTEEQMLEALVDAGLAHKEYDWDDPLNNQEATSIEGPSYDGAFTYSVGSDKGQVHLIGSITKVSVSYDDEGEAVYTETPIDGYHANVKANLPIDGLPTISAPNTPEFGWS